MLFEQMFHVAGQLLAFGSEPVYAGVMEQIHGGAQGGQRQDRRVADLPAFHARDGLKCRWHFEAGLFVVSPPSGKTGQVRAMGMFFMHKAAADASGTAVHIFVGTPYRKIDLPIVQAKRQITRGVRQIESYGASVPVSRLRDAFHLECLAGQIIHTA